ncbi:peptide ABC transporter substrate-binding protein [Actinomadura kijaniata]|uniref:peptide ABC transporter substrate-binding protein n=1 Tax=Actinomadura kijaniata TaxID=46161 RepID=UPI003F193686
MAHPKAAGLSAILLVVACSTVACGGGGGRSSDGTFTVGHPEPDHLVPGNTTSSYSFDVIGNLFENLVGLSRDGKPVMAAAESVTSTDQKVWTIKIRPGQKFHNGEPVTAASFADAWNNAAYGPNAYEANDYFSHIQGYDDLNPEDENAKPKTDKLSGLQVVDDTTLKVTLGAPFSQFPLLLTYPAFAPMPKAAFKDLKAYENSPVGNGPYQMSGQWVRNGSIKLVPFPGYTGARKPRNKGVIWKSYSSAATTWTDLRAGRIDAMQTIPADKVPEAKRVLGDRFLPRTTGTIDYLGFPLFTGKFDSPDLRRAISMAIDRQGINKAVYNGDYIPADSLLPKIIPGYRAGACGEACVYDPVKAKQLYDRSGGFKGTLELYFSNAQPSYAQWMQIVANSLRQNLGIKDIQFRQLPASDYFSAMSKRTQKGPYRQNWEADYPSAQNYLENMWGEAGNKMGWRNKEFNDLIAKGNASADQAEALKYYNKAEDIAIREMPQIPLWTWAGQGGRSSRVDNVVITPYATGMLAYDVTVK